MRWAGFKRQILAGFKRQILAARSALRACEGYNAKSIEREGGREGGHYVTVRSTSKIVKLTFCLRSN